MAAVQSRFPVVSGPEGSRPAYPESGPFGQPLSPKGERDILFRKSSTRSLKALPYAANTGRAPAYYRSVSMGNRGILTEAVNRNSETWLTQTRNFIIEWYPASLPRAAFPSLL